MRAFSKGDHGCCRFVEFLPLSLCGWRGVEQLPARLAPQTLHPVDRRLERRLAAHANHHRRLDFIKLALAALGAPIAIHAGVTGGQEDEQFVSGEGSGRFFSAFGPVPEAACGKAFLGEPEALAVVDPHLDGGRPAVAEDEHRSTERVFREFFAAQAGKAVDSFAEVDRFDGDQDAHLGGNLEHGRYVVWTSRASRAKSGPACPFQRRASRRPRPFSTTVTKPSHAGVNMGSSVRRRLSFGLFKKFEFALSG